MQGGARPAFPPGAPDKYASLAARCWAADAAARPALRGVVLALDDILADVAGAQAAAQLGAPPQAWAEGGAQAGSGPDSRSSGAPTIELGAADGWEPGRLGPGGVAAQAIPEGREGAGQG
jgi:hypothetical protein